MTTIPIYVEHNAFRPWLRALERESIVQVIRFPYDPDSRGNSPMRNVAIPSRARWSDCNVTWEECAGLKWNDPAASNRFDAIARIIGQDDRHRCDVLHVDSAYKSGCRFFFTTDKGDVLAHRDSLSQMLGIRFFHPDEQSEAERLIREAASEGT